ncbi:MAG: IS3 family transposase, partial [Bryobacteraceae bacterium]
MNDRALQVLREGGGALQQRIKALCAEPRHALFGYRWIDAWLRREGWRVNHTTVGRAMRDLGLSRPKVWHRPQRPERVERMRPEQPNQGWQIGMASFPLTNFQLLFLVVVVDCYT